MEAHTKLNNMDTNNLLEEINKTFNDLLQEISSFDEDQFNVVPFEGSWTGGQVVQHLVMSGAGFVQILTGPVKDTDRAPDGNVEKIKTVFLNFDTKMKSPDFILPAEKRYEREQMIDAIKDIQSGADDAVKTLDLSQICLARELPAMGFLTRLEAIWFVVYHTQRHTRQLKNIRKAVVNTN